MVSINISNSFQGTSKTDESVNESDNSGLENIFASMLSVVEDKNNTLKSSHEIKDHDEAMLLLDEIKNKLSLTHAGQGSQLEATSSSGILSENILQIYQTYKTLIDEALNVKDDATITFDMEKISELNLSQKPASLAKETNIKLSTEVNITDLKTLPTMPEDLYLNGAIDEFSELEMQRIKSSMKQEGQIISEIAKNTKKITSEAKDQPVSIMQSLLGSSKSKTSQEQNKAGLFTDQSKQDIGQTNVLLDSSRTESSLDQGQSFTKSITNKLSSPDLNSQSNQNTNETHLKLLEKNWGKDLAKIIEKAIISGKEKIDISLDPQKLGKMHLTLSIVNNQTSISISTENAAASLILSSAEERLAQMFESSGYKLSHFQTNSNGNNNSDRNGSRSKSNKEEKGAISRNEQSFLDEKKEITSYSIDGRKIINIIA